MEVFDTHFNYFEATKIRVDRNIISLKEEIELLHGNKFYGNEVAKKKVLF